MHVLPFVHAHLFRHSCAHMHAQLNVHNTHMTPMYGCMHVPCSSSWSKDPSQHCLGLKVVRENSWLLPEVMEVGSPESWFFSGGTRHVIGRSGSAEVSSCKMLPVCHLRCSWGIWSTCSCRQLLLSLEPRVPFHDLLCSHNRWVSVPLKHV